MVGLGMIFDETYHPVAAFPTTAPSATVETLRYPVERSNTMNRILAGFLIIGFFTLGAVGSEAPPSSNEGPVREAFESFQKALKAKDANTLWSLLDKDSQADAEREARRLRDAYTRAARDERAKQEKALGLAGAKLESLKGIGFLESTRFLGYYREVPESKIEEFEIKGDNAIVHYFESYRQTLSLVRQGGEWKLIVPMPTGDKLEFERTSTLEAIVMKRFEFSSRGYQQKITVSISGTKGPVSAYLIKTGDEGKVEVALDANRALPSGSVFGSNVNKSEAKDYSFTGIIPAEVGFSLLLRAERRDTDVRMKVVGR
jgi:hypothetical protein